MDESLKKQDIINAINTFSISQDSIILVHSSLKSLGHIEGGAETVISAISDIIPSGTLVMPTLCSKNWETVFEDWNMDRPSDVGYITETFRKQANTFRSDNATHSVAARGKFAREITCGAPNKGKRYGIFGDYCFSHYSAWQKMFDSRKLYRVRAYVIFFGVDMLYNTYKHFAEYVLVEETLASIHDKEKAKQLKSELSHYPFSSTATPDELVWPFYDSREYQKALETQGIAKKVKCGNGEIICCDIYDMVNSINFALRNNLQQMVSPLFYDWFLKAKNSNKEP